MKGKKILQELANFLEENDTIIFCRDEHGNYRSISDQIVIETMGIDIATTDTITADTLRNLAEEYGNEL